MTIEIVVATIAVLLIVEGILVFLFPRLIRKMIKKFNVEKIKQLGLIEFFVGLLLLLIYFLLGNY